MKKTLILTSILLLTACTATVSLPEIDRAIRDCVSNGGLERIEAKTDTPKQTAYCNNKASFEYLEPPKEVSILQ